MSSGPKILCRIAVTAMCLGGMAHAADFSTSLLFGYKGGMSYRATAGFANFAQGFPLALELGITHSRVDPGDPFPARRVFIADATNGTPEKSGYTWDFRMDFLYQIRMSGPKAFYVFAGPRFSMFDGTFHYVGANEEFDVTSNQWGVGFGAKALFAVTNRVDLTLSGGFDQYFNGPLHGHDTTYSPDNQNVNPKEGFTYRDAAAVVNAPKFQPTVMIGFSYGL